MDQTNDVIRKYALQNAVFFKGKANPKSVVGKVLGEIPELRPKSAEIIPLVDAIVEEVNAMGLEAQTKALSEMDSSLLVKEKKERKYELPELKNVNGEVVMRIAPGPSGPLHIGHTRASVLNDEYVKRYGGKLILRFEDTNPEKLDPDAYHAIPEDLDWLGVKIHQSFIQSDRFDIYYDHTKKLLEQGHAYVCTCNAEHWRELKEKSIACPCRDLPVNTQMERYEKFMNGEYADGEAVVVVKTDLHHPNPAVRDFVALRLVSRASHPRTGDKYIAYPMMNLSVAVDDHLMGMTHVIRGKDHLNNTDRQAYIFDYFGWKKPEYYHYGLVHIPDTVLKTSLIKKEIQGGTYSGWDDVRTGTVRALARRGIRAEAVRRYWVEAGMKSVDIEFSWDGLYAKNRDVIDPISNRYFFVGNPVEYRVTGADEVTGSAPLHPDHAERGCREYDYKAPISVFLSKEDSELFASAGKVRLKDLCNLEYGSPAVFAGNDVSILKKGAKAVQWVGSDAVDAELLMPDGTVTEGLVEPSFMKESGDSVQLERIGFVRVEKKDPSKVSFVFSHH